MPLKTALTFEEAIEVAYLYYIEELDQRQLSLIFRVNSGRISEACTVMKYAATNTLELYHKIGGAAANKARPEEVRSQHVKDVEEINMMDFGVEPKVEK